MSALFYIVYSWFSYNDAKVQKLSEPCKNNMQKKMYAHEDVVYNIITLQHYNIKQVGYVGRECAEL